ncbi:MAG: helix-turn-helix transcriptional regulator [Clostridia bacterium]|nr:helix-turn-helix transcriptional regulator [Clostridia bacterium]
MTFGAKIKKIRRLKGVTLKDLAEKTGLSSAFLSRLENDKAEATLNDLRKLADELDVSVISLLPDDFEEDIRLVRKKDRQIILQPSLNSNSDPCVLEFLLWGSKINLEPTLMTIPPGSNSGEWAKHMGEEFLFLLEGQLRVYCGEKIFDLQEGDTIGFPAQYPHRWENLTDKNSKIIVTSSLPTF